MTDDRAEFEEAKRAQAARMAKDDELTEHARALVAKAGEYDWHYQWSWLGLPIIQMPPDVVALQEIIWATKPDVVVEAGVARGGSLIFAASILQLIGAGKVVGIDIDIRPHNRESIESHPLSSRIELVEGSSLEQSTVNEVRNAIGNAKRVMVILDSNHTHDHVLEELKLYAPLVTSGQYLVVADTAIEYEEPSTLKQRPWGPGNNPLSALLEYKPLENGFEYDEYINAKLLVTASPGGFLRRVE